MPHIITKPTVCICGSRTITNLNLDNYIDSSTLGAVITGGAAGIDTLAEWWAKKHKLEWICYLPNYKIFGRAAPLKRDEDMVKASDYVIAFWDGKSSGTKYMISYCKKIGRKCFIHYIEDLDN